jgi:hypothetical protein
MPRAMLVEYPGAIYHVMDRGDRRQDVFIKDMDREDFLKTPAEAFQDTAWQVQEELKPLRRGWCLGSEQFRSLLHLSGGGQNTNTNLRGPTNDAHNWSSNLRFDPFSQ